MTEAKGGIKIEPGLGPSETDAPGPSVLQPRPGSLDDTHPFLFSNPPEDGDQEGAYGAAHIEPRLLDSTVGIDHGDFRFTRRMLREHVGWGQTQLRVHLGRLVEMEYILAHRAGSGGTLYELAWSGEGQDGSPFIVGLSEPSSLAARDRAKSGPVSVGWVQAVESVEKAKEVASNRDPDGHDPKKPHRGSGKKCRRSEGQG